MLKACEAAAAQRPPETVHLESFAPAVPATRDDEFTVVLAKSGRELQASKGQSILDVVLAAGIKAQFSCMEGVCSSCERAVLEGVPDHRDMVLSKKDREARKTMMICVSGSKSPKLVLDL